MRVLYLRPPRRRPVRIAAPMLPGDVQGAVPRGWCRRCGKEIFLRGRELCPGCVKEEQKHVSEKSSQPL